jgi:cell division protein FtsB
MSTRRTRGPSAPGRKNDRQRAGRRPVAATPSTRRPTRSTSAAPPDAVATAARSKFTGRALILLLVLAVLAVSYASSARAWLNQRSENNALRAKIAEQEATVAALKQDKRRWNDDDFIRAQAGARYGWVMPGEVGYRVIGRDGEVLAGDGAELSTPTEPAPAANPQWWDDAWGSMQEAGKTAEEVAAEQAEAQPDHQPATQIGGDKQSKQSEQPSSQR